MPCPQLVSSQTLRLAPAQGWHGWNGPSPYAATRGPGAEQTGLILRPSASIPVLLEMVFVAILDPCAPPTRELQKSMLIVASSRAI